MWSQNQRNFFSIVFLLSVPPLDLFSAINLLNADFPVVHWKVIFYSSVTGERDTQAYLNKSKFEQSSYPWQGNSLCNVLDHCGYLKHKHANDAVTAKGVSSIPQFSHSITICVNRNQAVPLSKRCSVQLLLFLFGWFSCVLSAFSSQWNEKLLISTAFENDTSYH